MFKSKNIKKALLSILGTSFMFLNNTTLALKYAKIVWIGPPCTGKTTLHKTLLDSDEKIGNYVSTKDISSQELLFKIGEEDVISYFWDMPGAEDLNNSLLNDFRADSNVAIVMMNADQLHDYETGLFNNCSYTFRFVRDLLKQCPNCKIVFGIIKLKDEEDILFKNEVANYMANVLCAGELKPRVAGWISVPNLETLNSKEGRAKVKGELIELIKKSLEMHGVNSLPKTSKNLHGKLEWMSDTRMEDNWVNEDDGETCTGDRKYKRVNRPKEVVVNKRLVLKKW